MMNNTTNLIKSILPKDRKNLIIILLILTILGLCLFIYLENNLSTKFDDKKYQKIDNKILTYEREIKILDSMNYFLYLQNESIKNYSKLLQESLEANNKKIKIIRINNENKKNIYNNLPNNDKIIIFTNNLRYFSKIDSIYKQY